jgi:hypothetical protein
MRLVACDSIIYSFQYSILQRLARIVNSLPPLYIYMYIYIYLSIYIYPIHSSHIIKSNTLRAVKKLERSVLFDYIITTS